MTEIILGGLALLVAFFAWLLHGATNSRLEEKDKELEEWSGVIDVRRKAEEAKHNDHDAVKRVRDKYNDPR